MNIAITGASGFLGPYLIDRLLADGHTVRTLGRSESGIDGVSHYQWDAVRAEPAPASLEGVDAVVNLIGEPVAQRWSGDVKQRIRDTRGKATRFLVRALSRVSRPPAVLVSGSAIGFYGDRRDELLTEDSQVGSDFLAQVCMDWEDAAKPAERLGTRVVLLRTGIVLGEDGGALKQMSGPFRAGLGGPVGSGEQWVSWIHVDDWVEIVVLALTNSALRGPINATAPQPVRNTEFAHALGSALHKPSIFPVPAFGLKLLYGEAASALLASQRVLPDVATRAGFRFRYSDVRSALKQIYSS